MRVTNLRSFAIPLIAILSVAGFGNADVLNNNEVQFTGVVKSVIANGEGTGTLFVTLDTIDLRVLINPRTIIEDFDDYEITMEDLQNLTEQALSADPPEDLLVEVIGKFSSSGILANRVRVIDTPMDFNIRGHITRIVMLSDDSAQISLLGITIVADLAADPPTTVERDGMAVPLSELKIGTKIQATGTTSPDGGSWHAASIQILTKARKGGLAIFEGTVDTYDDVNGILTVVVAGAESNDPTTVYLKKSTRVYGNIAAGAYVMVIGKINPDYTFDAREIRVLADLEIKPDELKMKVGDAAILAVKLREPAPAGGITVNLGLTSTEILTLSPTSISIAGGEQSGEFEVIAVGTGVETITASISGASPPEEATALIKVGQLSDGGTPPAPDEVRIFFSPDHIKLKPNESREVVLHIHPPHMQNVVVEFDSSNPDVVPIPTARVLSNGAAMFKVPIESTGELGNGIIITAALPAEFGGGQAELLVSVEDKNPK